MYCVHDSCSSLDSELALEAGLDNSSMIVEKKPPVKAPTITRTLGSKQVIFHWGVGAFYIDELIVLNVKIGSGVTKSDFIGKRTLTKSSSTGKRSLRSGYRSAGV